MIAKISLAKEFAKTKDPCQQSELSAFKFSFSADIEKEKKKKKKKKNTMTSSPLLEVAVAEGKSDVDAVADAGVRNLEVAVATCALELAENSSIVDLNSTNASSLTIQSVSSLTMTPLQETKIGTEKAKSKSISKSKSKENGTQKGIKPIPLSSSSPTKSGITAAGAKKVIDDDDRFLEEMIKIAQKEQIALSNKEKATSLKSGGKSTGPRFLTNKDPELSEDQMKLRKFGKGKNLSVIGPTKRRDVSWLLNRSENGSNANLFHDTINKVELPSSSISTAGLSIESSPNLHSSPFSFGFMHSNTSS